MPRLPARLISFPLDISTEDLLPESGVQDEQVSALVAKLSAEDQRLRRLLPEAPHGYFWEQHIDRHDDPRANTCTFTVKYRLAEVL